MSPFIKRSVSLKVERILDMDVAEERYLYGPPIKPPVLLGGFFVLPPLDNKNLPLLPLKKEALRPPLFTTDHYTSMSDLANVFCKPHSNHHPKLKHHLWLDSY